jgi:Phosphate-selective porin O and P
MNRRTWSVVVLLLAAGAAQAQDVKVNALVDLWYTQMMDNNLRLDTPANYYQLNSAFQENGFSVRRAELYISGKLNEDLSYMVLFDPNTATNTTTTPTTLLDCFITYKVNSNFSLKVGQYKPLQTFEASMVPATELLLYDRSQLAKQFGDKRDRGIVATYSWGDTAGLSGKVNVGVFNGSNDRDSGKANDANAQKDFVTRFEFAYGKQHRFGLYTRNGSTDAADKGGLTVNAFSYAGTAGPTNDQILDNKDKISNVGAYYAFDNGTWIAQAEAITGVLGRRFPSVGMTGTTTPPASRQHLDQKFMGYVVTGAYRMGKHTFVARYDFLNYNKGNDYYGPFNPYTQSTSTGADLGADYTPKFTEIVAGWTYTWTPNKWTQTNFKLNYIHRSKNFLLPRGGQSGEQGGDSIVAALQVGF